jgi:hypothetical protein
VGVTTARPIPARVEPALSEAEGSDTPVQKTEGAPSLSRFLRQGGDFDFSRTEPALMSLPKGNVRPTRT